MRKLACVTLMALLLIPTLWSSAYGQADPAENLSSGSLVKVPETASFYWASMNHSAMSDAIFESRAWEAIRKSKVSRNMKRAYRKGRTAGYDEYGYTPFAVYLSAYGQYYDTVIVNSVFNVIEPLFENELFVYVDNDSIPMMVAMSSAMDQFYQEFEVDDLDESELTAEQKEQLFAIFEEKFAKVEAPTMMIGCRVSDPEYRGMIELMDNFLQTALKSAAPEDEWVLDAYEVVDDDKQYMIYFELLFDNFLEDFLPEDEDPETTEFVINLLAGKSVCLAVGIRDNIVFAGVAKDKKGFDKFGSGKRLIDMPKMAKLKMAVENNLPITSVSYTSEETARNALSYWKSFRSLVPPFAEGLTKAAEKDEAMAELGMSKEDVVAGAYEFLDELEAMWPKPSMHFSFSHLTSEGVKSYLWVDATHPLFDGTKPAPLLDSVGDETLVFFSMQLKDIGEVYRFGSKWMGKTGGILEELTKKNLSTALKAIEEGSQPSIGNDTDSNKQDPKESIKEHEERIAAVTRLFKFAGDLDAILLKDVMPALKGEGMGVVIDMVDGPAFESGNPSRIPSIALIQQHHDPASLEEAFDETMAMAKGMVRDFPAKDEEQKDSLAKFLKRLDKLTRNETPAGSLIEGIAFPVEVAKLLEIDPLFYDSTLIAKDKLIFRFPGKGIEQLTKKRAGAVFGPASDAGTKPSVSAAFYNHQLMMDTIRMTYTELNASQKLNIPKVEDDFEDRNLLQFTSAEIQDHLDRIWKFAECWKGASSRTYVESGGTVTEELYKFEDLAEDE